MSDVNDLKDLIPILVFLLPGLLTAGVVEILVVTRKKDVFDRVVQALIFTFVNLVCYFVICWGLWQLYELSTTGHWQPHFNPLSPLPNLFEPIPLLLMIGIATGLGLLCAYEMTHETILGWMRNRGWTKRSHQASTWGETFSNTQKWVVVHLKDGRRIYGWPTFYSDDPDERGLFLENASWLGTGNELNNEGKPISVFLDRSSEIQLIEFVEETDGRQDNNR